MTTYVFIVATRRQSVARKLSFIVDIDRFRNRYVQVDNGSFVPHDRSFSAAIAGKRFAHDLTFGVDRICNAEAITRQSSEITDLPISPESCMEQLITSGESTTDCFPFIVEPFRE